MRIHLMHLGQVLLISGLSLWFCIHISNAQELPTRVYFVLPGVLGDRSFNDSAQRGLDELVYQFDIKINTVMLGSDPAVWEQGLDEVMADAANYDLLVVGSFRLGDFLAARAHRYPDKAFVLFDAAVPYADPALCVEGCSNVYSILYKQNESAFLAGAYAAAMTLEDIEGMNDLSIIGAVGGQDIPIIRDYLVGYEQGACLVNPDVAVLVEVVGSWDDPARAEEVAMALYDQHVDIIFQIAGDSGVGVFEAAYQSKHYALGVDTDQAVAVAETNPDQGRRILTSVVKHFDNSLYRAVRLFTEGNLPLGQVERLGIADGAVGLAHNEIFDEYTPADVAALLTALEQAVADEHIVVNTVFSDTPAAVAAECAAMPAADFDVSEFLSDDS